MHYYNLLMSRPLLFIFRLLLFSFLFVLTSCASQGIDSTSLPASLIPFLTSTQNPTFSVEALQTPDGLVTAETPLPSPTPFTYTVQRGDTMGSIALAAGVSIDDLQAANPEISPNAMSVGQVLKIPSNPENPSGEPTPTPEIGR